MTNKDEASPRQRVLMEQRWAKAREDCPAGVCVPSSRFHVAGCERRQQRTKVTNLVTGDVSEVDLLHTDVKAVMNENKNQAIKLEPVEAISLTQKELDEIFAAQQAGQVVLEPEPWTRWERGVFEERFDNDQLKELSRPSVQPEVFTTEPARPWWKRVFNRAR